VPKYHHHFYSENGTPKNTKVPNSCIQAAEYIIQVHHKNGIFQWVEGADVTPNVYLHFGSGNPINITIEENILNKIGNSHAKDYEFSDLRYPEVGEGVAVFNIGGGAPEGRYNMHFLATLAITGTKSRPSFVMSNLNEIEGKNIQMVSLDAEKENVRTFQGNNPWLKFRDEYQKENNGKRFFIGLLTTKATREIT
jgi:hypothetical protein